MIDVVVQVRWVILGIRFVRWRYVLIVFMIWSRISCDLCVCVIFILWELVLNIFFLFCCCCCCCFDDDVVVVVVDRGSSNSIASTVPSLRHRTRSCLRVVLGARPWIYKKIWFFFRNWNFCCFTSTVRSAAAPRWRSKRRRSVTID